MIALTTALAILAERLAPDDDAGQEAVATLRRGIETRDGVPVPHGAGRDVLGFQHGSPYALALDVLALQEDLLAHPALRLSTQEFEAARRALLNDGLIDASIAARLTPLGRRVRAAARAALSTTDALVGGAATTGGA